MICHSLKQYKTFIIIIRYYLALVFQPHNSYIKRVTSYNYAINHNPSYVEYICVGSSVFHWVPIISGVFGSPNPIPIPTQTRLVRVGNGFEIRIVFEYQCMSILVLEGSVHSVYTAHIQFTIIQIYISQRSFIYQRMNELFSTKSIP